MYNAECHLPFTYGEHTYYACTREGASYSWCATTPHYEGHWVHCYNYNNVGLSTMSIPDGTHLISFGVGGYGTWAISSEDGIYYMDADKDWVHTTGALKQISVGSNQVWGVNSGDYIYMASGEKSSEPHWEQIPGRLAQVSCSPGNHVWGVNSGGVIYKRSESEWTKVGGNLVQISAGQAGVWGINENHAVYYKTGTYGDNGAIGGEWQHIGNGLTWISSGSGYVIGVAPGGTIWKRLVNSEEPASGEWLQVHGHLQQIEAYGNAVYGLFNGGLYTVTHGESE